MTSTPAPATPAPTGTPVPPSAEGLSFPRHSARTQRFTLGAPRAFTLAPDGSRAAFLRSRSGTDRLTCLWVLDLTTGAERLVTDPLALLADGGEENLSPTERARRERAREGAAGIVGYATDRAHEVAAFALSSRLWVVELASTAESTGPAIRELDVPGPVLDPRPDPTGARVAYVSNGALRVVDADGASDRPLAEPDGEHITWGLAEFLAAEEMQRMRGYWWAPDGEHLLAARVDDAPVQRWHIADPANPETPAAEVGYPAAGTPNALVTLALVGLDGERRPVEWDAAAFPYLVTVSWTTHGDPLVLVQSRNQRVMQVRAVETGTGATRLVHEEHDERWLEVVPGVPAWLPDGRLLWVADSESTRRLVVDGRAVTPPGLQVRQVLDINEQGVLFTASAEPTETHLHRWRPEGALEQLSEVPGVHTGRCAGDLVLVSAGTLQRHGTAVTLSRAGRGATAVRSYADTPSVTPRVTLLRAGERALRTALLVPTGWSPQDGTLPVLMDPYGGPHAQRVVAARSAYLTSQWLADQGFAVVVVDGRGTPGRGPEWERAVWRDLAEPVLTDQVDALHALAAERPWLDLDRVAIRGWSFGGYLAALAVLRRPDVFHAAVAGAPVIDWSLYDTHYTERYLGTPQDDAQAYARSSVLDDAAALERPLMLVHGLADDNVVAAHTLRMSSALLAAGRAHTVLPLSGVTHMTPQEVVAENLLLLQVRFLHDALAARRPPPR
jgi:dipeptidyl-peptidase-4